MLGPHPNPIIDSPPNILENIYVLFLLYCSAVYSVHAENLEKSWKLKTAKTI